MEIEQRKTIINLYNSGINPEIIALELDVSQEEVMRIIESEINEEGKKRDNLKKLSDVPLLSRVYLEAIVNIDLAIAHAQSTMWKALKVKSEFNISFEERQVSSQIQSLLDNIQQKLGRTKSIY